MFGKPAMDMFAVELLLLSVLSGVSSQTVTEDEAKCGQQTTINYVYGADNVQTPEMGVRVPSQLHAGPPGKSGAPGQKGQKVGTNTTNDNKIGICSLQTLQVTFNDFRVTLRNLKQSTHNWSAAASCHSFFSDLLHFFLYAGRRGRNSLFTI